MYLFISRFQTVLQNQNQTSCMNNCMLKTQEKQDLWIHLKFIIFILQRQVLASCLVLQGSKRSTKKAYRESHPRNYSLKFYHVLPPPTNKWDLRPWYPLNHF